MGGVPTVGMINPTLTTLSGLAQTDPALTGATALAASGAPGGIATAYAPAVQIQAFEPAFYTPCPVFAMMPYSPATVSAVAPVFPAGEAAGPGPAGLASVGAGDGGGTIPAGTTPTPAYNVNSCGCCKTAYSPLPPNGYQAWQNLVSSTNAPYEQLGLQCRR